MRDPRIAHTRARVLRAARELIAEEGFAGATIEKIAERSGVARSTVYRRWPDPSAIYVEAFLPFAREEWAEWVPTGDLAADLTAYLTEVASRLNDPQYASALLALLDRAARDPVFDEIHRTNILQQGSRVPEIIEAGKRSGAIRADIDDDVAILAVRSPLLFLRLVERRTLTPELIAAQVQYLVRALG
jgi:AcrR family transcriptional regulator